MLANPSGAHRCLPSREDGQDEGLGQRATEWNQFRVTEHGHQIMGGRGPVRFGSEQDSEER